MPILCCMVNMEQNMCVRFFLLIVFNYPAAAHTAISLDKDVALIAMGDVQPKALEFGCLVWLVPLFHQWSCSHHHWEISSTVLGLLSSWLFICKTSNAPRLARSVFLMDTSGKWPMTRSVRVWLLLSTSPSGRHNLERSVDVMETLLRWTAASSFHPGSILLIQQHFLLFCLLF